VGHSAFGVVFGNLIILGVIADAYDFRDIVELYWARILILFASFQVFIYGLTRSQMARRLYTDSMLENLQNQQFLKVLLDTQQDGIVIEDAAEEVVTYLNPAFVNMTS